MYHNFNGFGWGDFRGVAVGIYSVKSIGSNEAIFVHSDRRIKKEITEIDDDSSLQKLRLLNPCYYRYIDSISRGENRTVEGFIAQEVEEVLPNAVRVHTDKIPNIMSNATYAQDNSGNKIITLSEYNTADLELDASGNIFTKLFIYPSDPEDYEHEFNEDLEEGSEPVEAEIVEVLSSTELRVEVSEETNEKLTKELFIYGQEVDNKCFLAKDKIFTVGISALQEVDRQLQAEKEKTTAIETKISLLETQRNDVSARLSVLENKN
jgi:primosomal replication protein N